MFSANVEEKHIKQTSIYDNKKKEEEDGGAFIHMNSGYYSIFFFIPISNLISSIYT
jgi:hypothetical protein